MQFLNNVRTGLTLVVFTEFVLVFKHIWFIELPKMLYFIKFFHWRNLLASMLTPSWLLF
uniref:Uncharacterized protein n=1 Tax=Arundo donax TaxID=35708 RepID=A0A0A9D3H8_ARUDO